MLTEPIVLRKWSGSRWEIALEHAVLTIKTSGKIEHIPCDGSINLRAKRHWLRWHLFTENKSQLRLRGISRLEAKLLTISFQLSQSRLWSEKLQKVLTEHREQQRWVPQEKIDELNSFFNLLEQNPSDPKQNILLKNPEICIEYDDPNNEGHRVYRRFPIKPSEKIIKTFIHWIEISTENFQKEFDDLTPIKYEKEN